MAGKVKVKMKTDRGVAKRFKKTGSGHFKCRHQNLRHILTKKSTKRKRNLRKTGYTTATEGATIRQLIPYK